MLTTQHNITAAYMFGGLRLPIGDSETVAKGDKLVGALGPSSAKGYVKTAPELQSAERFAALVTADIDDGCRAECCSNGDITPLEDPGCNATLALKGKGAVINFDTTDALVSFPG